jgi:hypothetical protein
MRVLIVLMATSIAYIFSGALLVILVLLWYLVTTLVSFAKREARYRRIAASPT